MTNWLIKIGWAKDQDQATKILLGILGICILYFVVKVLFFSSDASTEAVRYEDLPPELQEIIPYEAFQQQ